MNRILFFFTLTICTPIGLLQKANANSDFDKVRILMIASRAESPTSEQAIRAIQAQLSDLDIDLEVFWTSSYSRDLPVQADTAEQLAKQYNATMVFWCDFLVGKRVFLYVSEPGGGRILVRKISFDEQNQRDRFLVMAVILRSVVEAIAGGGHIGISPGGVGSSAAANLPGNDSPVANSGITVDSKSQPKGPEPRSDTPQGHDPSARDTHPNRTEKIVAPARIDMSAAYGLTLYSSSRRFIHGVQTALSVRVTRFGRLFLGYRIQIPFEAHSDLVSMTLRHHPFEVGLSRRFESGSLYLDLGAALVNDPLTWQVTDFDASRVAAEKDRFRWLIGVSPFVQLNWLPSSVFKFNVSLAADIYFNESPSYVERNNGDRTTVMNPYRVRPQVRLGVIFFLF
ncbi:MAG: hypothetical protein JXR76_21940 [Deltaproteobacteria bacterium]|nr:hypothetical protein [Deltaproteobacteria bacterium]